MIVLHHAESSSCTIKDIHNWHLSRGWSGCGYHFFVRKDGKIYRGRPENAIGAHCPGNNYPLNEIKGLATGGGLVIATSSQKVYSNENKNWLQVGDTGSAVLEVQQSLIRLGFGCGQSGTDINYGKDTKNRLLC